MADVTEYDKKKSIKRTRLLDIQSIPKRPLFRLFCYREQNGRNAKSWSQTNMITFFTFLPSTMITFTMISDSGIKVDGIVQKEYTMTDQ